MKHPARHLLTRAEHRFDFDFSGLCALLALAMAWFLVPMASAAAPAATPETSPPPESVITESPVRHDFGAPVQRIFSRELGTKLASVATDEHPRHIEVQSGQVHAKATVARETFEGAFPGGAWRLFALGSSDVTWGRTSFRRNQGSFSAWSAGSGSDAPGTGSDVPVNTESWMVAGPFDLSAASSGELSFDLWLETESGFDVFSALASLNGTDFVGFGRDQNNDWQRFAIDLTRWGSLGDLTTRDQVWFAFLYESDGSVTREGAYVDDVLLEVDAGNGLNLVIQQVDVGDCPRLRAVVSVTDANGDPVLGLENSFTLDQDGTPQTTTTTTPTTGAGALSATLVLDDSGSLSNSDIANVKVAAKEFIDLLGPNDRVAVFIFEDDVRLALDYTSDKAAAKAAVDQLVGSGSTSLYDAIVDAADHSTQATGRRALVVMTDGRNNDSVANIDDAINAARAAAVPVFTIGFGSADESVLERIADETGGLFSLGATSSDLQDIFNRIGQTLNNQYVLNWTTASVDASTHQVTVRVDHQGQSDTATASYSQAGSPCATAQPCVADGDTLCLLQDRFRVEVDFTTADGNSGLGRTAPCGTADSGLFWFFGANNWEMLIKVIDGCTLNDRFWVYFAATTDVGYTVRVTDTLTGVVKTYRNPVGRTSPAVTDTSAFATCP